MDKIRYLMFACGICTALAVFSLGIMLVGYQAWDGKHVVTFAALVVGAIVFGAWAWRESHRRG